MPAGRPRTAIPSKEELIELGKDLVQWASTPSKKGEGLKVRFCEWYTEKGFIMKQWKEFHDKEEFSPYYERARTLMANRWVDGTINHSIAHRYIRIYDPELRENENSDLDADAARKASALKSETQAVEEQKLKVLEKVQENKRVPQ